MDTAGNQALRDAIARNHSAVLSLPSAGMLRHCKTRFLLDEGESFLIESAPGEAPLLDAVMAGQNRVGVSFRSQTLQVMFSTTIAQRQNKFALSDGVTVEALRLRFPQEVRAVQRRSYYRVAVLSEEMSVRVWRIPEQADLKERPHSTAELPAQIRNISIGGIGLSCAPRDGQPIKLLPEERLRVMITCEGEELLLEGRTRYLSTSPSGIVLAGVQFRNLESDLDGRRALARLMSIVGKLQREELRRTRLGMMV